jgi:hypothetical protein
VRIAVYQSKLNSDGSVSIAESSGEHIKSRKATEILQWLIMDEVTEYRASGGSFIDDYVRVCWNLDDTIAPLLTLLGKELCQKLYTNKKVKAGGYSIFYIPSKIFSFKHLSCSYQLNLFGIDQYYPEVQYQTDMQEIEFHCRYLLKVLKEMGIEPKRLTSAIKIYEQHVIDYLDLPTTWDIPQEAAEYAWYCSGKLWIEAHKLGYWKEAYDYDINSAFPTAASRLYDTRRCNWIKSNTLQAEAVYGYCKCKVTINDNVPVSPIIYTDKQGKSYSPVGSWLTYLTKMEILFIYKFGIGTVEILDGWWAMPSKEGLAKPLEIVISRLLEVRKQGGLKADLAKRMAVGLYGKFGEEHADSFGKHFNPCWFAEISSIVRLRVAAFIYNHMLQDSLIHVSVDGVLTSKPADIESKAGNGNWKLASVEPALVLSSGLVWQGSKKPNGLNITQVEQMISEKPRACYWEATIGRRVTLGQALEGKFEDLGKEQNMFTSIDINMERDRYFSKLPKTGNQLLTKQYNSKPLKVKE